MLKFESTLTPDPSRLWHRVVEFSLAENLVDGCVAYGHGVVVAEVSFDAAWSPVSCPSELKYEIHGGLSASMDHVGFVGFQGGRVVGLVVT